MQCTRCGGQAADNAAFCPFCGEILNIENSVQPHMHSAPPVYTIPPRKNNTWMLVVGIIFVVLVNIIAFSSGHLLSEIMLAFSEYSDELSSPESVATAYVNNVLAPENSDAYGSFNYHTTIDWDMVFADIYAQKNGSVLPDYDKGYEYAEKVYNDYCKSNLPKITKCEITVDSVTEMPYTSIHDYIGVFDDYFRTHGLSAVDYIAYSDIKSITEVSLSVTAFNESGESATIPVIVNVAGIAENDSYTVSYYDVLTDSLFTDSFIAFALSENLQGTA